ncbi:glycosyltransferase [Streptomyces sp. NPDC049906]|uniref:glycosyltransferase n=1 Tax=Streptomyces sp. NPDC049906 TaxID=3155656 RepID=UPI00341EDB10
MSGHSPSPRGRRPPAGGTASLRRTRRGRCSYRRCRSRTRYNGVPLIRNILDALGALPDTEVLATVEEEYREALGEVPGKVRVIDPVPLHLLLGSCRAVIHHGGSGTAMTASVFGLPQLVLPQLADQFWHGDALARVGAGITIEGVERQDEPEPVREAVATLLGDPAYARAAGELGEENAAMPAPSRVVTDLEELVAAG